MDATDAHVHKAEERSRYELVIDGRVLGIADYHLNRDVVIFPHTEIAPEMRGRGLGEVLVRGALDDVRASGRHVMARCWFVRDFIAANPDYADLRAA